MAEEKQTQEAKEQTQEKQTQEKINISGKEYSVAEIEEALKIAENQKEWNKSNNQKAEELARQRKQLEEERQNLKDWEDFITLYGDDENFRKHIERAIEEYEKGASSDSLVDMTGEELEVEDDRYKILAKRKNEEEEKSTD